ncbi:unnamed protein product [Arctia plantaginis]|uniref:Uncharacterized protein n=1 Tax=Arctia plantaginis TaxID=874455 RepID=A0A8S1B3M2_ARCPL|nr:unnamed protein product [Arctia plantaginis]
MAPKRNYTPQQMGSAIEAVRKGAKISDAAKKFNVKNSKHILDHDVRNEASAPSNSVESSNHVSETHDQNENASPKENESIGVLSYYTNDSQPSASLQNICLAKKTSYLNTSNVGQEDLPVIDDSLSGENETIAVLSHNKNGSEPGTSLQNNCLSKEISDLNTSNTGKGKDLGGRFGSH